jgi:sulfonate transport system permease protein
MIDTTQRTDLGPFAETVRRTPSRADRAGGKRARGKRIARALCGVGVPLLVLVLWQVFSDLAIVDSRLFSSPSRAWAAAIQMIDTGQLQAETWITIKRLLFGYLIGALAGMGVGLLLSQSFWLRALFEPLLRALYTVPKLAILPILLLVLGIGETPKIAFVAIGTFFIMGFASLAAGLRVPVGYLEVAKSHNLSAWARFRRVVLPASMPEVFDGLRLASGMAVLLVVAVEFINSSDGIGHLTWQSWQIFAADRTYVGIVVVSVLGVAFSAIVAGVGRLLMPWNRR